MIEIFRRINIFPLQIKVSHPEFTLIHKFITNPSNPDCEDLYDGHDLETSGKSLYPSLMLNMVCKISKKKS